MKPTTTNAQTYVNGTKVKRQSHTIPFCNSLFGQFCACFPRNQSAVWGVMCTVWGVKCGVWSVGFSVGSIKGGVRSVECKERRVKSGVLGVNFSHCKV